MSTQHTFALRIRRDTTSGWTTANPVLGLGEAGWDRTSGVVKIGDGTTAWLSLPVWATIGNEAAVTAALAALTGGATITNARLIEIVSGEPAFRSWSSITRDSNGVISAGTFTWPDGSAGVWTTTGTHATGAISGFTAAHATSGKTVTVTITRDAEGNATATTTTVS